MSRTTSSEGNGSTIAVGPFLYLDFLPTTARIDELVDQTRASRVVSPPANPRDDGGRYGRENNRHVQAAGGFSDESSWASGEPGMTSSTDIGSTELV